MDIQQRLNNLRIRSNMVKLAPGFHDAVALHYQLNLESYKKQPLFYKAILQDSRFNIVYAICCLIFSNHNQTVSQIKEMCVRHGIASPNSVIAILTLLKTSGRVHTWRDENDRRKIMINATEKGILELKHYMKGAVSPLNILYPHLNINEDMLDNPAIRHAFFSRAAESLFSGIIHKTIMPEASVFLDKDAGRMLMIYLWLEAKKTSASGGSVAFDIQQKKLADMLCVSRTHIRRIISKTHHHRFTEEKNGQNIVLLPAFFTMVEDYAAFYFCCIMDYLNISHETCLAGGK